MDHNEFMMKYFSKPAYMCYSARTDSVLGEWLKINDQTLFKILESDMDIKYNSKEEQPEGFNFFCKIALQEYDKANPFNWKTEFKEMAWYMIKGLLFIDEIREFIRRRRLNEYN